MPSEIPAFLITFREALEVALIMAIVLAYLKKIGRLNLSRYVWIGTGAAVVASVLAGSGIYLFYGELAGVSADIFEGIASLTAMGILTYMIFWMATNSREIKGEVERKIDLSITKGQLFGIATLAFVAVFREGIETVLFLTALFVSDAGGSLIGTFAGIVVVGVLGALMLKSTTRLPIRDFFKYTSVLLVMFSAGLLGAGVHDLIEAAGGSGMELGLLAQAPFNINPIDSSNPFHERGVIGSVMKALVGYDGNPEWLRIFAYVGYWLLIGPYLLKTYAPSLFPGDQRSLRVQEYAPIERTGAGGK